MPGTGGPEVSFLTLSRGILPMPEATAGGYDGRDIHSEEDP